MKDKTKKKEGSFRTLGLALKKKKESEKLSEADIAKLREMGRKHAKKHFVRKSEAYVMDVGFEDAMDLLKEKNPLFASFVFEGMIEQRAAMEREKDKIDD